MKRNFRDTSWGGGDFDYYISIHLSADGIVIFMEELDVRNVMIRINVPQFI
jgi:hypothetical protein